MITVVVQYLRMLTNSLIGGALFGAYVAVLVLQLNPMVQLNSLASVRLMLTWWTFYGIHAAAFFYALIVLRQLLADEVRSPGWLSLRLIAVFGTFAVSLSALVTWLNLRGFGSVLGPDAASRMTEGALVLSVCAAACGSLAILQLILKRGRGLAASAFGAVLLVSLIWPLVLRGPGVPVPLPRHVRTPAEAPFIQSSARVSMILLDGAALDFIATNAAGGRFPHFGRLLEMGAVMHLATLRPTQPAAVWTAVATGKLPYKTGIYSAARYVVPGSGQPLDLLPDFCFAQALVRFGLIEEVAHASDAVRARPLWELLSSFGIATGVIDWPLTYPAHPVHGYLISDELLRRDGSSVLATLGDEPPLAWPADVLEEARAAQLRAAPDAASVALAARRAAGTPPRDGATAANPLAIDAASAQLALDLGDSRPVQFAAVRYPGIDAVGHYYLRYATPRAFGDVSDEERLKFGRVLEQYYTYVDGLVGRAMNALGPDDLLLVVSGFGMEPLSLGKRVLERLTGDPDVGGSHERAPDGFVAAYGRRVATGNFPRASVVDIAPTVLYFLGLPIARDLDGFARTDIFDPGFTADRPITFIPYYDR
jgi:Type I phosphodiesterase / nucleotide pyrophosphatase